MAIGASAKPSGIWGHGVWGVHDDGQWHGEGLVESQDWAGHHGAIVAPGGIVAPAAAAVVRGGVLGLGHGIGLGHGGTVVAGPAGAIVAQATHGAILGHGHLW